MASFSNRVKIVVAGYYGFGNAGDELLLRQTIRLLRAAHAHVKIVVLNREGGCQKFGESTVNRMSALAASRILSSDALVFGGGGLFQDTTSSLSFWYYAGLAFLATISGKKVLYLAQGISELSVLHRRIFVWLLRRATLVTVRDKASLSRLEKWGFRSGILTADLAFFQAEWISSGSKKGGISLRPLHGPHSTRAALENFVENLSPAAYDFLSFQDGRDPAMYNTVASKLSFAQRLRVRSMMSDWIDAKQSFPVRHVIGMRYHACVFAALQCAPFLALAYDDKVVALAEEFGQPFLDLRTALTSRDFLRGWDVLQTNDERLRASINAKLPTVVARANAQLELVKKALQCER